MHENRLARPVIDATLQKQGGMGNRKRRMGKTRFHCRAHGSLNQLFNPGRTRSLVGNSLLAMDTKRLRRWEAFEQLHVKATAMRAKLSHHTKRH